MDCGRSNAYRKHLAVAVHQKVVVGVAVAGELVKMKNVILRGRMVFQQPVIEPLFSFGYHLVVVQGAGRPDVRSEAVHLLCVLDAAIPPAFIQIAIVPYHCGKGFDIVEIYCPESVVRRRRIKQVEQDQSTASAIRRSGFMLYKTTIQKYCGIAILMHGKPGAAGIAIFREHDVAGAERMRNRSMRGLPPMLFIAVGSKNNMLPGGNESYCAHCCLNLMVDEATPNSSGNSMLETSVMPTLIKAM